MGFDELHFNGGLKPVSVASRKVCGVQRYKVHHYQDLNALLGQNWHIRIVHKRGEYNYVILDTMEFYLRKNRPVIEYVCAVCSSSEQLVCEPVEVDAGLSLVVTFVVGYGIPATFEQCFTSNYIIFVKTVSYNSVVVITYCGKQNWYMFIVMTM